jgi:hypothetical protein
MDLIVILLLLAILITLLKGWSIFFTLIAALIIFTLVVYLISLVWRFICFAIELVAATCARWLGETSDLHTNGNISEHPLSIRIRLVLIYISWFFCMSFFVAGLTTVLLSIINFHFLSSFGLLLPTFIAYYFSCSTWKDAAQLKGRFAEK